MSRGSPTRAYRPPPLIVGGSLGGAVHSDPPNEPPAARSLPKFGSAPGPRKGVPASPLRFDPGTPFLDQHITDVYGEARCRAWGGSERAAASRGGVQGCEGLGAEVARTGRWGRTTGLI